MTEPCDTRFCSLFARSQGEQPVGNAPQTRQFLVVEVPTPWPRNFLEAPTLPQGLGALLLRAYEARIDFVPVGVVPDEEYSRPGLTRVMWLRRPEGAFARFERGEWQLPTPRVAALCEALLFGDGLEGFEPYRSSFSGRDLLVCTHGTVDVCCAKFGYPVYRELRERYGGPGLRLWRCTHFGGHRFAPTLIDLPTGHYWGFIGPEDLDNLVFRDRPVFAGKLRGWSALDCFGQMADGHLLEREGWGWLDRPREGRVVRVEGGERAMGLEWGAYTPIQHPDPPERVWVRLTCHSPGGEKEAYEVLIERAGVLQTVGQSGGEAMTVNRYRVREVREASNYPKRSALGARRSTGEDPL